MSNYEQIKTLLQKNQLSQVLLIALSNSLKIKLTTTNKNQDQIEWIETKINLLKGITTKINDRELLNSNHSLVKFHQQEVEKIYEIWDKNRETLAIIMQILAGNKVDVSNFIGKASQEFLETEKDDSLENDFSDFELESNEDNNWENNNFEEENQESEDIFNENEEENWINDIEDENNSDISIESNFDEITDEMPEKIFNEDEQEIEEEEIGEANWDNLMEGMSEKEIEVSETIIKNESENEISEEEIEEDWEEWLEENETPNHKGEYNPDDIDWNEENWEEEEEAS